MRSSTAPAPLDRFHTSMPFDRFDTEVLGKYWIPLSVGDTETATELRHRLGVDFEDHARGAGDFLYLPVVVHHRDGGLGFPAGAPDALTAEIIVFALGQEFLVTLQPSEPFAPFDEAIALMGRKPLLTASSRGVMYAVLWALNQHCERIVDAEGLRLASVRAELDAAADNRGPAGARLRSASASLNGIEADLAKVRETQRYLSRAAGHLRGQVGVHAPELDAPMAGLIADIESVTEHAHLEHDRVRYTLESLRAHLDVERDRTVKVLTTVTAALLTPTLLAALYGLRAGLPDWEYGVLIALPAAVLTVVAVSVYVARRGGSR